MAPLREQLDGVVTKIATAYRALFTVGGLRAGETLLVLGAGSGVSTFAVSLAAQGGARALVTSSSEEKIERGDLQ